MLSIICTMLVLTEQAGYLTPHHVRAKRVNSIQKIVDLPLPHIYRSESCITQLKERPDWIVYRHTAYFTEPIKSFTYNQLDSLCNAKNNYWSKNTTDSYFQYTDDAYCRAEGYSILCRIYTDHSYVEYCVDKNMYNIPKAIFAGIITIAIVTIVTWGATLLFIRLNDWFGVDDEHAY